MLIRRLYHGSHSDNAHSKKNNLIKKLISRHHQSSTDHLTGLIERHASVQLDRPDISCKEQNFPVYSGLCDVASEEENSEEKNAVLTPVYVPFAPKTVEHDGQLTLIDMSGKGAETSSRQNLKEWWAISPLLASRKP